MVTFFYFLVKKRGKWYYKFCYLLKITLKRTWWGQSAVIGLMGTVIWIVWAFDPTFNPSPTPLLLLLPLIWGCIKGNFYFLDSDDVVITPKNMMLLIWFHKLIIIPLEILTVGNKILPEYYDNQTILTEILIYLISFGAFLLGWLILDRKTTTNHYTTSHYGRILPFAYISIAFISLLTLYGSIQQYVEGAIFSYVTQETLEQQAGSIIGFVANIGQRFWPFGIMLIWSQTSHGVTTKSSPFHVALWLFLATVGILSSNRSNMVYPLLAFGSVLFRGQKVYSKWLLLLFIEMSILLAFFFGYIRVQPYLDYQHIEMLFDEYLQNNDYIWSAHQLYLGSPYQLSPLLNIESPSFTLIASLLDPVPILGKDFREYSGPSIYNQAFHDNPFVSQDKVIPVAGELFFNGGYILVFIGHFVFGVIYRWFDVVFKQTVHNNVVVAACFFYLMLLFSATLLLSLSVLVQFLLYNALPALLIIGINWLQIRKAS